MAQMELGVNPEQHPLHELWSSIDLLASQPLTSLWAIRSLSAPIQNSEKIKQLHQKEAESLDILCKQILMISSELRSPETISYQKLNPQAMLKIKNLSCDYSQWLEQTTYDHLATELSQISKQRFRQIILRVTLIDYIRSAIIEAVSIPSMTAISNKS